MADEEDDGGKLCDWCADNFVLDRDTVFEEGNSPGLTRWICDPCLSCTKKDFKRHRHYAKKIPNAVDHPSHFNMGNIEVIEVIDDWRLGFYEGNIVKYIARAKHKGKEVEDLEKAAWYLKRLIGIRKKKIKKGDQK